MNFLNFLGKKARQTERELKIVAALLQKEGFVVKDHIRSEEPYVYVESPNKSVSFGGIRIYKIGKSLAFRIQREEATHPYGSAYPLAIEDMYNDLLADEVDEEKAGNEIIKTISMGIKRFFDQSAETEKELQTKELDPNDKVLLRGLGGSDYSNKIYK